MGNPDKDSEQYKRKLAKNQAYKAKQRLQVFLQSPRAKTLVATFRRAALDKVRAAVRKATDQHNTREDALKTMMCEKTNHNPTSNWCHAEAARFDNATQHTSVTLCVQVVPLLRGTG